MRTALPDFLTEFRRSTSIVRQVLSRREGHTADFLHQKSSAVCPSLWRCSAPTGI